MTDRQPYVVGIDPSLTATGIATAGVLSVTDHLGRAGITKLPLDMRVEAIEQLVDATLARVAQPWETMVGADLPDKPASLASRREQWPDLVVIEAPDTSARYGGLVERIAYWHMLVRALCYEGVPVASHPSAILKGYATGKGSTGKLGKAPVIEAVAQYWPQYGMVTNDNECDAVVLAQMGLACLTGRSDVPAKHADWLLRVKAGQATVVWPETSWEPTP